MGYRSAWHRAAAKSRQRAANRGTSPSLTPGGPVGFVRRRLGLAQDPNLAPKTGQTQSGARGTALVVKADLARHLEGVRAQHQRDLHQGAGWVELPTALIRKYPNAGREWVWQWVFPATRPYRDPETGVGITCTSPCSSAG